MKKLALLLLAFTFTLTAADIDGPWRIAVISFGRKRVDIEYTMASLTSW